jgi:O-antigen/teichoic acid export membrane protein
LVFGSTGAYEAGIYYIALSVAVAISSIMTVLLTVAIPTLSAMNDGRKRLTWNVVKISLIVTIPFAAFITFNPSSVLQLLSPEYTKGSVVLAVLLLPLPLITFATGVSSLAFAYGKYKHVLILGLASSVPRTILYIVLVPLFGSIGAAEGYTIGSATGFIASIFSSKLLGIQIPWKDFAILSVLPLIVSFAINYVTSNSIVDLIITLVVSYASLLRMSTITRGDIEVMGNALPGKFSSPMLQLINRVGKGLNSSY